VQTTMELVTAVRDQAGSDRKAAPLFGVSQNTFSEWRNGTAFPTDDYALKIAALLQLAPEYVLAIVRHDRAGSQPAKRAWRRIAESFKDAAVLAAVMIGAASFGVPMLEAAQCVLC
jgi:hypothetical protein